MTVEDDAIQRVRKLQEITKNTRESHKKSNKNALEIYLKENHDATIAAKERKCSRGGGGTPEHLQRDRERDDWSEQRGRMRDETAAGGLRGGLAWWWTDARRDGGRGLAWWWLDARQDSGGWTRDETAVAGGSRGGLEWWARRKLRREEETTTAAQQWQWQRQHERR
ncbi:hypothetical protein DEO72_LG8g891 [Vigna unguiculata]|uniref:Uncharacterized protein n=1 Tax=Vigna unguiculata TaxID=3917 RepID=A0A4D6MSM1_VIGUN|nr:hypothetical protein DEO72_LG8g891 [Vigna unguiculata]